MPDDEKDETEVNEDGYKVCSRTGRVYGKSALSTRDPERDKIVIKKKSKAGRKKYKNKLADITDEMREQVCIWSSGGVKMEVMSRMLQFPLKILKEQFVTELGMGKAICVAKVHEKVYKQAMSDKRDALTAQSQKMFMQNVGDWRDSSKVVENKNGANLNTIMDGMSNTERHQRFMKLTKDAQKQAPAEKPDKQVKTKPKNIEFN